MIIHTTPSCITAVMGGTFLIGRRKDEEKVECDYRIKRVVLEIYAAMAVEMRKEIYYRLRLDPPLADPKRCHPPREAEVAL